MSKVRVASFSISIDGFGAGARQDLQNPLGVRGPEMFSWFFQTDVWKKMHGQSGGGRGVDNQMAERAFARGTNRGTNLSETAVTSGDRKPLEQAESTPT